ncbi:hypothetical protein [Microbulbifer sp. NBRC 101763]|uniref:hypothetical protein n=1 Tax=Microbulbifer sp. NBRC 101763 TaxID=1113820 RepID=UPI00333FF0CB
MDCVTKRSPTLWHQSACHMARKERRKPKRQARPLPAENTNRPFHLRHKQRGSGQRLRTAQEKVAARASSRLSPRLQKKRKQAASHHLPLAAAV